MMNKDISDIIAAELNVKPEQVKAAITLLDEGSTVPFIARYRKEVTGSLDDGHLRQLETRLHYLRELAERKQTILKSIGDQGKLTEALTVAIAAVNNKTELEDLYLPFKPKRRTRGQIAIEAGLEPLAETLWMDPSSDPAQLATTYINTEKGIDDEKAALNGARYILMERFAEDAALLSKIRHRLWHNAHIVSRVIAGEEEKGNKFKDYFDHHELIVNTPSHRALAMFRGRKEGVLHLSLNPDPLYDEPLLESDYEQMIRQHLGVTLNQSANDNWRKSVINWTWRIKILIHMETELMSLLREQADTEAINVFSRNIHDLLMAAPAGSRVTMGLDPGLRTGVKVTVVSGTGKVLDIATIYPHTGQAEKAAEIIAGLCLKHHVELVAIGNGTASRETERFFNVVKQRYSAIQAKSIIVSEAGASVYSASEVAALEFPNMDVSLRGAVSIARRLQDPLAELVKIDPKSIGVGQYQHDVSQIQLAKKLDTVVEDCVNGVGVDLNTASVPLLTRVSGLTRVIAQHIVDFRNEQGTFTDRQQLLAVSRLGPKAFEQCAGFLRISGGKNPLDASAVHPEAYAVVERILQSTGYKASELVGNSAVLKTINAKDYTDDRFGLVSVSDIIKELEKVGRDPRPEFKTATLMEGIETLNDLSPGLILEGTVTNVTNFGAFVDIGVHQDGLVHISVLADRFITDPHQVVKAGDIVKVRVTDVDILRKRIALSMKLDDISPSNVVQAAKKTQSRTANARPQARIATNSAFGDALSNALSNNKK